MHYAINSDGDHIIGVVAGVSAKNSNATADEYFAVKSMLLNPPDAPDGFYYRLTESLEWVLCELPTIEAEATETDYQAALRKMGVNV